MMLIGRASLLTADMSFNNKNLVLLWALYIWGPMANVHCIHEVRL